MTGSAFAAFRPWNPAPRAGAGDSGAKRGLPGLRTRFGLGLLSLRTRLVLFALLCALPVFTLLLVQRNADEARIRAEARADVARTASQLHRSVASLLASVEAVGRAVATVDLASAASLARCNEALGLALEGTRGQVLNYTVLDLRGKAVCSGRPATLGISFADRPYFREALDLRVPAMSGHMRSRLNGTDSLVVAVPRLDARGEPTAVITTGVDARALTHGLVTAAPGMVMAIFDSHGVLVSRAPDSDAVPIGQAFPGSGIARFIASGQTSGVAEGADGVVRFYEVRPLMVRGSAALNVAVGQDLAPLEEAAAAVRRRHALVGLGVLALVMAIAALAARPLVLARVRLLLESAAQVGADDGTGGPVRVPVQVQDELTPVETAFNAMLERLERKRLRLEGNERRYRLLFDTGADGVLHLGADGSILAANGAACRLLGRDEAALRAMDWPQLVDPTDERQHRFVLDGGAARALHGELRLLQSDGVPLECELSASLFGPGSVDGLGSVVIRDLTLRLREQRQLAELNHRLEVRVQQRTADLEAAVGDLTAFSYSVSHDLRAPMGTIQGFATVLQERGQLTDPKDRHYLSRILASSNHANSLIDGLLLLARITRDELVVRDIDLGQLAQEALAGCRDAEPGREVAFSVKGDLLVRGDSRLLRLLIDNLVGNAWKFTGGTEHARITVESLPAGPGAEAIFRVRDNGAGFDPAHAGRLFEPFQRMHSAREFPGTGIGLATARRVVRRHGGRVWAESMPGQGTSLYFTLRGPGAVPVTEDSTG
jgi:PAS domain S-box-containing protein